jgi:inner membrane protein involved in colicin E2 resistance
LPLSLTQQILLDTFAPPVGVALWWLFSRGTATILQGGSVSERTRKREKVGFVILLALGYAIMFGITIYAHLTK